MVWVEPIATTKLLGYPHSPHQRQFCTEDFLGWHCLKYAREILSLKYSVFLEPAVTVIQNSTSSPGPPSAFQRSGSLGTRLTKHLAEAAVVFIRVRKIIRPIGSLNPFEPSCLWLRGWQLQNGFGRLCWRLWMSKQKSINKLMFIAFDHAFHAPQLKLLHVL